MRLFKSHSSRQTKNFAANLAKKYLKSGRARGRRPLVFALSGDLGSGKTTFVQGFLRALRVPGPLTSPTFVLVRNYPVTKLLNYSRAYHIDAYRIKKPRELIALGLREILANPQNIVLIEWAEKVKKLLPKNAIRLQFEHGEKENQRIIKNFCNL